MQNVSIHMLIDNIQAKYFVKFDIVKIMIHLAWVPNSMVIFSASYLHAVYLKKPPFLAKKSVFNFFGPQSGKIR